MGYWVVKVILTPILRMLFRVRVEGAEHLPPRGPAILASNHLSFCDSIFLPLVLRRRVTFVAKAEYFEDKKTAWFFRSVGQIPIKRGGGSASQRALESAKEVLEQGGLFGIYPEGTRSPDGRLYKGHTGVARLALATGAPIHAVAMLGTREAQPIGQIKPNFFSPITVRISPAIDVSGIKGATSEGDPNLLRRITDDVMFELAQMSGQEYVDRYAKRGEAVDAPEPTALQPAYPRTLTAA
ncbi:MAG TPA: lysophospholipid acyltransferase family protein [Acidimicrobiales bacterium]|nr:lysophospholipid acyltransferase family protein [Acidimicrobiales bacterium]